MRQKYFEIIFIAFLLSSISTVAQQKCVDLHINLVKNFGPAKTLYNDTNRFYSPVSFIAKLIPFSRPSLTISGFTYDGPTLSTAQLKALLRFSSRANKPLVKGDKINILRFEEMKSEALTEIGIQHIRENGIFERQLLENSEIEKKPIEVLSFRLHLFNGSVIEVPIMIKGDINSVDFDKGSFELFNFLRGDVSGIQAIEIAHTHPTYAVRIVSIDGSSKFRANEISTGDFQAALSFARRIPFGKTVIIKAILPNGFNYLLEIPTGR